MTSGRKRSAKTGTAERELTMIQVNQVSKRFGSYTALDKVSCEIADGCIYGLVGSNGAGKSTLLRLITGVYRADSGSVTIDGAPVYDDPAVKANIAYVPDELFFLPQANMNRMADFYGSVYPNFSRARYEALTAQFGLNPKANIGTFSKGMKRQAATILGLACTTRYLLFDETFDGLDPVMRNFVKSVIYEDICDRGATAVITSHSLRELEDTCDQLALLHKGGLILQSDVGSLKTSLFKVQAVFDKPFEKELFSGFDLLHFQKHGSVCNLILRGDQQESLNRILALGPMLAETLPLTLEEVFLYEMEALGYSLESFV